MCELVCELENILSEMQAYERRLSELFDAKVRMTTAFVSVLSLSNDTEI